MSEVVELPTQERPLSEQYRIVAKQYVDADAAARLLEEMKSTTMEQQKQKLIQAEGAMPDSHAERRVKAGDDWSEYINLMVTSRTKANRLKLQMEYIKMRFTEWQSVNATARAEMKLSR